MHELAAPFFNFGLLVAVLAYLLRTPMGAMIRDRSARLRSEIGEVAEKLRGARQEFEEYSAKLRAIGVELEAIRRQAATDAETSAQRIAADAKRAAQAIVADAAERSAGATRDFQNQLRVRLGEKVVRRVEEVLVQRITGADRARIRQEFSREMEAKV